MRKIPAPAPKEAEAQQLPSETSSLAEATSALNATVSALNQQARALAQMVVDARQGPVHVQIERDENGAMTGLIIDRAQARKH